MLLSRTAPHLLSSVRSASPSCSAKFVSYTPSPAGTPKPTRSSRRAVIPTSESEVDKKRMFELYNLIKNYKDERGRELSLPFLQLPSKFVSYIFFLLYVSGSNGINFSFQQKLRIMPKAAEYSFFQDYPDYYDVIRKPVDLAKIQNRISSNYYDSVDALIADFNLMFDNACRYNEPESMIYKVRAFQRSQYQCHFPSEETETLTFGPSGSAVYLLAAESLVVSSMDCWKIKLEGILGVIYMYFSLAF